MSALLLEEDASGKVKEIYGEIKTAFGMVPNFFKAQAALDPDWLELNWNREKKIMLEERALDRKTKELIAMAVSLVYRCEYCSVTHEMMARMTGATPQQIVETKEVVELFSGFTAIADSLRVPLDAFPKK
jgi:AhpD family alkylhydroperoxidase